MLGLGSPRDGTLVGTLVDPCGHLWDTAGISSGYCQCWMCKGRANTLQEQRQEQQPTGFCRRPYGADGGVR